MTTTKAYDNINRLTGISIANSSSVILNSHSYAYNVGNQRTNQTRTAGDYVNYTYDPIGQLTQAFGQEASGTNRLQEQLQYAYDTAHNLSIRTNNALIQNFGVNSLNELTNITRNATAALTVAGTTGSLATNVTINSINANLYQDATFAKDGFTLVDGNNNFTAIAADSLGRHSTNAITVNLPATATYTYDGNGNLLSDGTRNFTYDDENELTSVWVTNNWRSDFVYDGKMRRRIRREYVWQSSAWQQTQEIHYVYDGTLVVQERWYEPQLSNTVPQQIISYTWGNDLSGSLRGADGIGGLLARTDSASGQTAFYHADGNGNVTMLVNASQAVVAKYLYDPYGNILSQSGSLAAANLYRFSSKEYHPTSSLVYYLYRYYDSNLQRWINRDPLGESGGVNLFSYVINEPTDRIDPDGLVAWVPLCCAACAGFAVWDIIDALKGTCAGLSGSDLANCLLKQLLSKAGLDSLASCIAAAIAKGGSTQDIANNIAKCVNKCGVKAARDLGKILSCTCCAGSLGSKIPIPKFPPVQAPPPLPAIVQ